MPLKMVLDCREHKLINIFPDSETKQLDIGDIIYVNEDDNDIKCIIERKTMDDLSSSIIDGRYKEQKCRLLASGKHIIYLIEGMSKNKFGVKYSTLLSAMLNIQLRDDITVIRTKNIDETSQILIMLKEKISSMNTKTRQISYDSLVHLSKKGNLTKDTVYINQLSCIPNVSEKIAKDICKQFPTLKELILRYESLNSEDERNKLLTNIDGIGMIISKKVYNFLF